MSETQFEMLAQDVAEIKEVMSTLNDVIHAQSRLNISHGEAIQSIVTESGDLNKTVFETIKALTTNTRQLAEHVARLENEIESLKARVR